MIFAEVLLQVAIYSRDIAPLLAFHCNRCHGDEITAGGVDTRTYENLRRTTNAGLMLELMEGRRGGSQQMPRDASPLDAATIARFREWVNAGARFDREPPGERLRREIVKKPEVRIEVKAAGRAYVVIEIQDLNGNLVTREAAVIQDVHQWTLRAAKYWPPKLVVNAIVHYASSPATLEILS